MTTILVLPDMQVKPGVDLGYVDHLAQFIVDKKPDVIVNIGDFADMPSLSSYDVGKKAFEGRRYTNDIQCVLEANDRLFSPLYALQAQQIRNKKKMYDPHTIITLGNHENRINRAVNNDAKLEGLINTEQLEYELHYDEVLPFLDVKVLEGVAFSHYFTSGVLGRPATTAAAQMNKKHMSCVAGHQQGLQVHMAQAADGRRLTSIIAGSCYDHNEDYLGAQGNKHWRGALMLHDVKDGEFNLVPVPLDYLKRKYS